MAILKEIRNAYAVFRIHRTEDIRKVGFGKGDYFETFVFYNHLKKHGLKTAIIGKSFMAASHFREVNKGYPRGFIGYRTYNEKEQQRRFGATKIERDKKLHISDIVL